MNSPEEEVTMMTAQLARLPRLQKGQTVNFIGGMGTVKNYQSEAGVWNYLVEMEMGPIPEMGRVGCETMVWLPEAELSA